MVDNDVEDVEEELKTSGSFNMKKFREKLKSGDFVTGKNDLCAVPLTLSSQHANIFVI